MLDFPVRVERNAPTSLQVQLTEQLRRAILDGRLAAGTRLPSTRTLAARRGLAQRRRGGLRRVFAEG